jgi:pimeloyl-ACP methyl ester carboxylesterase
MAAGAGSTMMQAFNIAWDESAIDALKQQIAACPLPAAPPGAGWSLGCDADFLKRFRDHWLDGYDWRAAKDDLNRYPQYCVEIDGIAVHFVHVKTGGRPLLLTHGWPGSHYEFWGVVDDLARNGFDLIIPSLPGYAFSGKPVQPIGPLGTARLWHHLMTDVLGYSEYLAQGGDWGSLVTAQIALNHAPAIRAIHLNMLGLRLPAPPQDEAEKAWLAASGAAQQRLSGYSAVQMMKPQSLAWLGAGNPLGQAAWILERFHDWADLRHGDLESVFGLDHLTTNIMLYAMTDSFGSALLFYHGLVREMAAGMAVRRCETPTGYAAFPGDALMPVPPRSRVELTFNLVHWSEFSEGGHFAAMEKPALFAADVIAWGDMVWPR